MKKNDKRIINEVRGTKNFTADEILKYLEDNGKVDLSYVQDAIEMKKRQELLEKHPYKVTQGKDGYWRTYFPDDTKSSGRRQVKKKERKDLEDEIISLYDTEIYEFKYYFESWIEKQKKYGVSNNTVSRYNSDYKRYFEGTDFERSDIRKLNEEDITGFIIQTIKRLELKERAASTLWGYISGTFKHARIKKIITENPCEYVEKKIFSRFYNRSHKTVEQRTISDRDLGLLLNELHRFQKEKPEHMPPYAVELAIYTGMRIGELAAIKWSNINYSDEYILIDSAEIYDRKDREWRIKTTKTGKERRFPLTEEVTDLLKRIKKVQIKYGFINEFVFQGKNGRAKASHISNCIRDRCEMAGIEKKSIHALRRTFNSKMRLAGISPVIAASLLGHSEQVNEGNYTYDISDMDYKKQLVSDLTKKTSKISISH